MQHIAQSGLQPQHVGVIPGAAGGPKGLILGPLDRFIFGEWLAKSSHEVHLVGASIGAWRMATACLKNPVAGFEQLEHDYAKAWTKLFERRLWAGRQIQRLFGAVWTSNFAVSLAQYGKPVAHYLMKKTHGTPF